MRYGSVCSGIEAASVAWEPLGWTPAFFAEIECFPSRVLAHHFPSVPNLGDFTKIGAEHGGIDVLVGGTPCQSFSVAGERAGLDDPRGVLTLEFLRLAQRLGPRWIVWENVLGVLSHDKGRTFGSILGALVQLGYGFAYRVLDAQFFGVPQRRRRVFVVGCAGGQWQRAAAVLFERESLCGDSEACGSAREGVAGTLGGGSGSRGWCDDTDRMTFVPEVVGALTAKMAKGTGGPSGDECQNIVAFTCKDHGNDVGVIAPTLRAMTHRAGTAANGGGQVAVAFDAAQITSRQNRTRVDAGRPSSTPAKGSRMHVAHTLRADGFDASEDGSGRGTPLIPSTSAVRRLTPRECERLQGFPDDWTAIPGAADGPRYRAIGNSMAVPVMRWIGERLMLVDRECPAAALVRANIDGAKGAEGEET